MTDPVAGTITWPPFPGRRSKDRRYLVQASYRRELGRSARKTSRDLVSGPVTRAALLVPEAAAAVDALFNPWEVQLEAALQRLAALQMTLDAQARRLSGLENELAELAPVAGAR